MELRKILFFIMCVLLIFFMISFFLFAFANHRFALIAIRDTLEELKRQPLIVVDIENANTPEDSNDTESDAVLPENRLSPKARIYLEELKTVSEKIMDSSTVSFLFQALLLFVVTGALYILKEAKDIHESSKSSLLSAHLVAKSNSFSLLIKNLSSNIQLLLLSVQNQMQPEQEVILLIPSIRDCYKRFEYIFLSAKDQSMVIQPSVMKYIRSTFENLEVMLDALKDEIDQEWISDIQKRNQDCLDMIYESEEVFKNNYDEYLKKLDAP